VRIQIDGRTYILTQQSIQAVLTGIETFAAAQYDKLPDTAKLAAMAAVRAMLAYAEKAEKDPGKKKAIRPVKGTDPTLHLVRLLLNAVGEALPHVECEIGTTDEQYINNFAFKHAGTSGGPISTHGDIRERQDDSSETTR